MTARQSLWMANAWASCNSTEDQPTSSGATHSSVSASGSSHPEKLVVPPLMLLSPEQPDKNPIHRQMIKIDADLTEINLKKDFNTNILVPSNFNGNGFIFPL